MRTDLKIGYYRKPGGAYNAVLPQTEEARDRMVREIRAAGGLVVGVDAAATEWARLDTDEDYGAAADYHGEVDEIEGDP